MSHFSRSQVITLEIRLRDLLPRMGLKLQCLRGLHNTRHPNPVLVTLGSNSFMVDRDDLSHFEDVLDNDIARNHFRESYLDPFLDLYANGDD